MIGYFSFDNQHIIELIEEGAEINGKDDENKTPLHWAALNGDTKVIEVLL